MIPREDQLNDLRTKSAAYREAKERLEDAIRYAVSVGIPYTDIGIAVGKSETTVRQLSQRRGWSKAGDRAVFKGIHDQEES